MTHTSKRSQKDDIAQFSLYELLLKSGLNRTLRGPQLKTETCMSNQKGYIHLVEIHRDVTRNDGLM